MPQTQEFSIETDLLLDGSATCEVGGTRTTAESSKRALILLQLYHLCERLSFLSIVIKTAYQVIVDSLISVVRIVGQGREINVFYVGNVH